MHRLINILRFIFSHPIGKKKKFKALYRFVSWQISHRLNMARSIFSFVNNTKLFLNSKQSISTGNYYVGLLEFEEMCFTAHFLRSGDTFFDIGANIGTYSVISAGIKKARTLSFEPVSKTFSLLEKNIELNELEGMILPLNYGLAEEAGYKNFTVNLDSKNHILIEDEDQVNERIEVKTLNNFIEYEPNLIKADVEGYELHILKGGKDILKNNNLKAFIIEENKESERYHVSNKELHDLLESEGFDLYQYFPFERKLKKQVNKDSDNSLYIRDIEFVKKRVKESAEINVFGIKI